MVLLRLGLLVFEDTADTTGKAAEEQQQVVLQTRSTPIAAGALQNMLGIRFVIANYFLSMPAIWPAMLRPSRQESTMECEAWIKLPAGRG